MYYSQDSLLHLFLTILCNLKSGLCVCMSSCLATGTHTNIVPVSIEIRHLLRRTETTAQWYEHRLFTPDRGFRSGKLYFNIYI